MEILSAEFVVSNTKVEKCPQDNLPEYAFIGRSNVGKSVPKNELLALLGAENPDTIITFGAGDIDRFCEPIAELLGKR